ncbi:MAG: cobyric acid synthase [Desulfobacteraceae bacterium]
MKNNMAAMDTSNSKRRCLAVFGTGSDVGKSVVAAAICRVLADMGENVAPFKSQNMSNNSGITPDGLEMGRAQIVQAEAARIAPHVDMNPVLLKPTGEMGSQVVLNGRAFENSTAVDYHNKKEHYFKEGCNAYDRLEKRYDTIVMEGAGSCAEVNLMASDIVNFPMAEYAGADVVLVADIHRGGVFAQIVGTLACLPRKYREMVKGFIINRFRGDITLFNDGVEWLENRTGKKVFGVLPWYTHFRVDAEDSVEIEAGTLPASLDSAKPAVAVIRLPHISNFTDFHPLSAINGLDLAFVDKPCDLSRFNAVILPGSKNTRADLAWIKKSGWAERIKHHAASGGHLLGICGGFQMLGLSIDDPAGIEDLQGTTEGLGLLNVRTTIEAEKTTTRSSFTWNTIQGQGYEIHMGRTERLSGAPMCRVTRRNQDRQEDWDGCTTHDRHILGTYMHGFFDTPAIAMQWLSSIGAGETSGLTMESLPDKERDYDLLKTHFEQHVNVEALLAETKS